jgi:hypothetical protein
LLNQHFRSINRFPQGQWRSATLEINMAGTILTAAKAFGLCRLGAH